MIVCDNPSCKFEWFQFQCIGLQEEEDLVGEWFCPSCTLAPWCIDIPHPYLGLLSYLSFCSSKFVNKEVENSNEMLIKSVRELKRFPHLGGGFTSQ